MSVNKSLDFVHINLLVCHVCTAQIHKLCNVTQISAFLQDSDSVSHRIKKRPEIDVKYDSTILPCEFDKTRKASRSLIQC